MTSALMPRGWEYWEGQMAHAGHADRYSVIEANAGEMTDEAYWKAVGDAWSDSERTRVARQPWAALFNADRPGREHLMEPEERAELAALPDKLTVYRGCWCRFDGDKCYGAAFAGLSWTLDPNVARWFALRASHQGALIEGRVRRERIIALQNERREREVIVFPRYVHQRTRRWVKRNESRADELVALG